MGNRLRAGLSVAFFVVAGCGGSSTSSGTGGAAGMPALGGSGGHTGGKGGQSTGQAGAGGQAATGGSGAAGGANGTGGAGGVDGGAPDGGGAKTFTVGGTVTGLAGTGLALQDGAGHQLTVGAAGAFAFPMALPEGTNVAVTVAHQPASPTQSCVVTNGAVGALGANVTNVAIVCTTNKYTIGGSVTGLSGSGLVLRDNQGDDLSVSGSTFTFATPVASGATYTVTVKTQPSSPAQTCQVSGGSGAVGADNVTSVAVNCAVNTYTVGGTITGLVGTGLVLENNASDDLSVTGNGSFAFAAPIASGGAFSVAIKAQPSGPGQVCSVSQGSGSVASANVTTLKVTCATNSYPVEGTVSGLSGAGLVLQDNLGDNLSIIGNGPFEFPATVADGAAYAVSVLTAPSSPSQTCTITGGSGTIAGAGVSNVAVHCVTNAFAIGGNVVGLSGSGLVLHNGGDDLAIALNGAFAFPTAVPSGGTFSVSISAQPSSPVQSCAVSGGSGTVGGAAVTSITVNCATDQFTLSGTVNGLGGSGLTLSLNSGAVILPVSTNGTFSFPTTLPSGMPYAITVDSQPSGPTQSCVVSNGAGTVVASNVSDVEVDCTTNSYQVGGTVSGLAGMGLTLQNNAGDDLSLASNGSFVFPTSVLSGQGYAVTVSASPTSPWQTCTVSAGSGGVAGGDVTNVAITCTTNTYKVGGTVTGLGSSVALMNGSDTVVLSANGPFVFPTKIASGGTYAVSVTDQPTNPTQICTVGGGSGTVAGADATGVTISCVTSTYAVGGLVTGLSGSGLTLEDNGGDDLVVSANGTFTFPTPVPSGGNYLISIKAQPSGPTQTCVLAGASGSIGAAPVTSVSVNCSINSYSVAGTVMGLTGSGLVIQNNAGGDLAISGSGTFSFSAPVASGDMYDVTVKTQPTNPWQTCVVTGGTGTVTNASIAAQITCTANPYSVSVNVSNLAGSGLVLQDNAGDNLAVSANGVSTFATPVRSGLTYAVTVFSQPTNLWQTCNVTSPAGTVAGGPVTLAVNCVSNKFTVGGTVSGLNGAGLVLQDNAGDNLSVSANGSFTFTTAVASGGAYAVTVATLPSSPAQNCVVTNGTGTMAGAAVNNVGIACTNVVICATASENGSLTLTCPTGQKVTAVDFASYGTPNGSCGGFTVDNTCNATTSTMDVTMPCVGQNTCTVAASNGLFGDPCVGTIKRLYVQARCQ
jgi:large repetitive protein